MGRYVARSERYIDSGSRRSLSFTRAEHSPTAQAGVGNRLLARNPLRTNNRGQILADALAFTDPLSGLSSTRREFGFEENQIHLDGLALRAEGAHRNTQDPSFWKSPIRQGAVEGQEIGLRTPEVLA
jgi:hypothetical protein